LRRSPRDHASAADPQLLTIPRVTMQGEDDGFDQSEDGYPDDDWNRR
jgi:hypothetical protein